MNEDCIFYSEYFIFVSVDDDNVEESEERSWVIGCMKRGKRGMLKNKKFLLLRRKIRFFSSVQTKWVCVSSEKSYLFFVRSRLELIRRQYIQFKEFFIQTYTLTISKESYFLFKKEVKRKFYRNLVTAGNFRAAFSW